MDLSQDQVHLQKTGMSKIGMKAMNMATMVARVAWCQNLNSGSLWERLANVLVSPDLSLPSDERFELFVGSRRQATASTFRIVVGNLLLKRRVELGRQESEEHIEQENAETVCDNVPTLCEHNPQHEEQHENGCSCPSKSEMRH